MCADRKCVCGFIEQRAFRWASVDENWNLQVKPGTAAILRPLFYDRSRLVRHMSYSLSPNLGAEQCAGLLASNYYET
jgi:hypothetical protein